jgi:antitoxin (DNA-binding transcriptional repressor) of toxin-antitoxin stability system
VKNELTKEGLWTKSVHILKTVTVRDLRNSFSMLETWLSEGESIVIAKRGQPIGVLTPWRPDAPTQPARPDFAARRRAIWGDRVFTEAEVASMRADELEGEEG